MPYIFFVKPVNASPGKLSGLKEKKKKYFHGTHLHPPVTAGLFTISREMQNMAAFVLKMLGKALGEMTLARDWVQGDSISLRHIKRRKSTNQNS